MSEKFNSSQTNEKSLNKFELIKGTVTNKIQIALGKIAFNSDQSEYDEILRQIEEESGVNENPELVRQLEELWDDNYYIGVHATEIPPIMRDEMLENIFSEGLINNRGNNLSTTVSRTSKMSLLKRAIGSANGRVPFGSGSVNTAIIIKVPKSSLGKEYRADDTEQSAIPIWRVDDEDAGSYGEGRYRLLPEYIVGAVLVPDRHEPSNMIPNPYYKDEHETIVDGNVVYDSSVN